MRFRNHAALPHFSRGPRLRRILNGRGDLPKDLLAWPGPLLADDAGDPELRGLEHALLFEKLADSAQKGGGLFQTARLLEEE